MVTNNSFVDQIAFDGMRKHLLQDFTQIYHIDLHGNVRQNPKLSGTTHNVFGIQVGAGVTVAIKRAAQTEHHLMYHRVPELWRKGEKYDWLAHTGQVSAVEWRTLTPDVRNTWLVPEQAVDFAALIPIGSKETKAAQNRDPHAIFKLYSLGVVTSRDDWAYDFSSSDVEAKMRRFIQNYNLEVFRYSQEDIRHKNIDDFVNRAPDFLKWSDRLKEELIKAKPIKFNGQQIRKSLYRPFTKTHLYFDALLNQRQYQQHLLFPTPESEQENLAICVPGLGHNKSFQCLIVNSIPGHDTLEKTQCFPFYVYDPDGTNCRENITDWALAQFRTHFADDAISKWDIFYYVYGVLHHPGYREKFADNLKRELPRIPFAPGSDAFRAFADAGRKLADLHLNYETVTPYKLRWIEAKDKPLSYHVEKMRLSKDKSQLVVNESLTLADIPPEVFAYRLGNRSALDWVIDQYQVTTDKRSGITSDPNREDDPRYIVDLVARVIQVSLDTVRIVAALPAEYASAAIEA